MANVISSTTLIPGTIICPDTSGNTVERDCCPALFVGPMAADGTATPYQLIEDASAKDYRTLLGDTSPLTGAIEAYLDRNPGGLVQVLPYNATGAVAAGDLTFAGTATENAIVPVNVDGHQFNVTVLTGDTGVEIADAIEAHLATLTGLAIALPAAASDASVPLNASAGGSWGNGIVLDADVSDVPGITVTVTEFAGGAGGPVAATATAAIGDCCCYGFIGLLDNEDTEIAAWSDNLELVRWGCECWTGGRAYIARRMETFTDVTTWLAGRQGLDRFMSKIPVCPNVPVSDHEVMARYVGAAHNRSCDDPSAEWTGLDLGIRNSDSAQCDGSCWTREERDIIANRGGSTIVNGSNGFMEIEIDVGAGILDTDGRRDLFHMFPQAAYQTWAFAQAFAEWESQFRGLRISFEEITPVEGVEIMTPNMYRSKYKAFLRSIEGTLIENLDAAMELLTFSRDPNNPSAALVEVSFDPISAYRQSRVILRPRLNLQELV